MPIASPPLDKSPLIETVAESPRRRSAFATFGGRRNDLGPAAQMAWIRSGLPCRTIICPHGTTAVTEVTQVDPASVLRSRRYVVLLVLSALIGVPISAGAWAFLALVTNMQGWLYTNLPHAFGMATAPSWWPLPILTVAGIAVALAIRYLPGEGGHVPARGLAVGGRPEPAALPGIAVAAIAGLGLGIVLGPEAPLIALGGGVAALAVRRAKWAGQQATSIIGAAGSFAAVSALLGSPLLGAFLLMEASGLSGAMLGLVLVPGLLTSGIGSLVFTGLGSWTGLGTFSLQLPLLPRVGTPTFGGLGWALVIGLASAALGTAIRRPGLCMADLARTRVLWMAPVAALLAGVCAMLYTIITNHPISDVLFSGQNQLGPLLDNASSYTAGALVLLVVAKSLAYLLCLGTLRGGPTFPAMFIGAAGGIALSHLPGLPMVTGAAVGIGAMATVMLRLPLTATLLATVLMGANGIDTMPLVIVAVVVSYVATAWLHRPQGTNTG
jgi:H+/Cl- antiporter ClcA